MYVTNFFTSEGGMLPIFLKKQSDITLSNAMSLSRSKYIVRM